MQTSPEYHEGAYQKLGLAAQRKYPNEPMLRFLAGLPRGGKVLEIGCGSGANLWAIAKEGFDTCGMDISPTALDLCREVLTSYNVSAGVSIGDMHKIPCGDEQFDAVIDVQTLQHTDRKEDVIKEVRRVLKVGGSFFSYHLAAGSSDIFPDCETYPLDDVVFPGFSVHTERYIREYEDGKRGIYLAINAKKI